ncbi:cadmium resistance transporter [Methanobacterium alcaliphilum]|uniref:cadmium resistance transporter n=1 Tax=Methanobacterium alcaliphilum TaxID=392018 RepID=UPI00200B918B|nr:cadmium resistance transporter [Methanobacterium alcaliphilum]MCK9151496.1 cadmium resistance transporter [Methanobacterium alcaliphilum]
MTQLILTIFIATSSFIATNLDDIFLLIVFFAHPDYKTSSIITGQFLGISLLILISFPAFLFKSFIPPVYLAIMGVFPLIIGLKQVVNLHKSKKNEDKDILPISKKSKLTTRKTSFLSVMGVTIFNGADNIGVYAPLFANLTLPNVILTIFIFLIMTGIWCIIAHFMINKSSLGNKIRKYGHIILPFILILLGFSIIIGNLTKI